MEAKIRALTDSLTAKFSNDRDSMLSQVNASKDAELARLKAELQQALAKAAEDAAQQRRQWEDEKDKLHKVGFLRIYLVHRLR